MALLVPQRQYYADAHPGLGGAAEDIANADATQAQWGGVMGDDPLCPYNVLRAIWEDVVESVLAGERTFGQPSTNPHFTEMDGGTWTTTESRNLPRLMAATLGMDASEFGAKTFRIGGATDIRAMLGEAGIA
eukprot:6187089-Pleurochrysis_carterae.AAC.3